MWDSRIPGLASRCRFPWSASALAIGLAWAAVPAQAAISVTITDATPTLLSEIAECTSAINGKKFTACKSTATVSTTAIGGLAVPDVEFKKSFDAWNAGLPAGAKWTLVSAGLLPGGSLKISVFDAYTADTLGGVEIRVLWD